MPKAVIIYYSRSGNTKKMAELVAEGMSKENVSAEVRDVRAVKADELLAYDVIVMGSPVYYGAMAYEMKALLDDSVKLHGKLDGKIGGAFASSANVAGGNETTVLGILSAMLIHGMIICGDPQGDHYGPVSIGSPDARATKECLRFGSRLGKFAKRLTG